MSKLTVLSHPLLDHKLSLLRDKNTNTVLFRTLVREISFLLAYPVTADFATKSYEISTPLGTYSGKNYLANDWTLISILRAGNSLADGLMFILPEIKVGTLGLSRNEETLKTEEYYSSVPQTAIGNNMLLVDPMLATGNTIVYAAKMLKKYKPKKIRVLSILSVMSGIKNIHNHFPDIEIFTAAVDEYLTDNGYIYPGLGDAGDRYYNT